MSALIRPLKNPPISEAIIEFKLPPTVDFDPTVLLRLRDLFASQFDLVQEQRRGEAMLQFGPTGPGNVNVSDFGVRGLVFRSETRQDALVISDGAFSFSKLRPYTSWEDFESRTRHWWAKYSESFTPSGVGRIGLRYINQFSVATGTLATHLDTPPAPPSSLRSDFRVAASLSQVILESVDDGPAARVVQVAENADGGRQNILLDVDCFVEPAGLSANSETLWTLLAELRQQKNRIFFSSITEDAAEEFDK